ncbi:MAG: signal peptide peptidase SppA, partial [Terriglobia bacterium]
FLYSSCDQGAMAKKEESHGYYWFIKSVGATISALITAAIFITVLLFIIALFIPAEELSTGNVAVIPIKGEITTSGDGKVWQEGSTPSQTIIDWLKEADEDPGTKAILLEIDSPGGSPVATDEIARAVKETNKTVIAVIREAGASGAFWIATAADYVFANRMSETGSIGVIGSHLEFAGLLKDYNITYRRLVAGQYKDAGSRWKEMTPEELQLYQQLLDEFHETFIEEVANNRKLPVESVRQLAHGFVFSGRQAKELGLVDAIGSKGDAVKHIEQQLNITAKLYEFKAQKTFFEEALGVSSYNAGKGIGAALLHASARNDLKITT